jgi:hypothetical protein
MDFMMLVPTEQWHTNGIHPPMPFTDMEKYLETFRPRQTPLFGAGWVRELMKTFPQDEWYRRRMHPPVPFSEMRRYIDRFRGGN